MVTRSFILMSFSYVHLLLETWHHCPWCYGI
nr:MAG TPA: hypothetical protein [Caudoviricetes sp.]